VPIEEERGGGGEEEEKKKKKKKKKKYSDAELPLITSRLQSTQPANKHNTDQVYTGLTSIWLPKIRVNIFLPPFHQPSKQPF